jgi:hypothetical protein
MRDIWRQSPGVEPRFELFLQREEREGREDAKEDERLRASRASEEDSCETFFEQGDVEIHKVAYGTL